MFLMTRYFINVGKSLSSKISVVTNCPFTETSLIPNHSQSFFLRPIGVQKSNESH